MGNASIIRDTDHTPCFSCKNFTGWTLWYGKTKAAGCKLSLMPFCAFETGCRYWEREPGADDEMDPPPPPAPAPASPPFVMTWPASARRRPRK